MSFLEKTIVWALIAIALYLPFMWIIISISDLKERVAVLETRLEDLQQEDLQKRYPDFR